jgi:hypothetical protein
MSPSLVTFLPRQPKEVLGPEEHIMNEYFGSCVGGTGDYPPGWTLMVLVLSSLFPKGARTVSEIGVDGVDGVVTVGPKRLGDNTVNTILGLD